MSCPTTALLKAIGDRWSLSIVHVLQAGAMRYQTLLQALPGISTRTLTDKLKQLEGFGLVSRKVFAEAPPRVEYSLTSRGQALEPIFVAVDRAADRTLAGCGRLRQRAKSERSCPACSRRNRAPMKPKRKRPAHFEAVPEPPTPPRQEPVYFPTRPAEDVTLL